MCLGNHERRAKVIQDAPVTDHEKAIKTAVEALRKLIAKDKQKKER